MAVSGDVQSFLSLMDACFCKLDIKFRTVEYAYYKNQILGKNMSFEEFFVRMSYELGIVCRDDDVNDVYGFAIDTANSEHVFFASGINTERKAISITKTNLDDGSIGLYFDNLESKRELLNLMDPLTSTYQKMAFINYVNRKRLREKTPYALMILDIDNFKGINDNYGHLVGDQILKGVASVLRKNIKNGVVGRYGGDEFVFVTYSSTDYHDIWNLLYKITHEMYDVGSGFEKTIDVSVTIGVARSDVDGDDFDELFVKADRALYRGKRKGKNCFIIYDDEKHKNINVDGVKKTIIDGREEAFSTASLISNLYDIISKSAPYTDILENAIEYISTIFNADRAIIYTEDYNHIETPLIYRFRDAAPEAAPEGISTDLWKTHDKNGLVVFNKVANLETVNPILWESLIKNGVNAVLRSTLRFAGSTLGSIEINAYEQRDWSLEERAAIIAISNFLSIYLYKMNETIFMEQKNTIDSLTNTINYSRFISNVQKNLDESTGEKKELYYLNLSKFKMINDKFGFKAGDEVLKKISEAIKRVYKTGEFITRVNGDRFVFYRTHKSVEDIEERFKKLVEMIKGVLSDNEVKDYLLITCGAYISDGTENNPSVMVDNANVARKLIGDTQSCELKIYSEKIKKDYELNRQLEIRFPAALQKEEFKVFIQPKCDMNTGELVGGEALSRWMYKNEKFLSPAEYIPVLEKSKQIEALDLYVFDHVCQFINNLKDLNKTIVPISVNISRNIDDILDYVDEIETIRSRYNVEPEYLQIEITESMFNKDSEMIVKSISKLHGLGYKVLMDDFGSGYSNLSSLAECGFDVIKIDKSLCTDDEQSMKTVVLQTIMELANRLGADVVCEGVETEDARRLLLKCGCKIAQGYLYDKPISMSDFTNKYL